MNIESPGPGIIDSVLNSDSQKHVGGKETSKQHDLGGEEQPDTKLGVVQPGVASRRYFVWNFHMAIFLLKSVKSFEK